MRTAFSFLLQSHLLRSNNNKKKNRTHYLEQCVENIKNNNFVPDGYAVLTDIFCTFLNQKKKKAASSVIESIQHKFNLLEIFFDELIKYKKNVAASTTASLSDYFNHTSNESTPTGPSPTQDSSTSNSPISFANNLFNRRSHIQNIQIRLNFLEFLLTQSSLELSTAQLEDLWDCLVTNAINQEETNCIFSWLHKSNFTDAVMLQLFQDKMIRMEYKTLQPIGFEVFERYFLKINEQSGKIKLPDSHLNFENENQKNTNNVDNEHKSGVIHDSLVATSIDVNGLEELWMIALFANDNEVSRRAIQRLSSLFQYTSSATLKSKATKIRDHFLATALKFIFTVWGKFCNDTTHLYDLL